MASSPITVPGLPAAAELTGAEQIPFHQNGRLVRATPEAVVNGVPITPTGGTVGRSIADIAQRVFSPYDKGAVSDAVIASDNTASASLSAAENNARLQAYFDHCRDYRIPWVLPLGDWLVDAGIKAYGPGVAYGRILASNDGRVRPGTDQAWGAPFTVVPYPEDILEPPTLAQIKTWTGVKRGSTRIGGLNGLKDQYITVLTTDQWLVDRRDRDNTNPGATDVRYNPMYLGEGFLVTDDAGEIAYPLIEDWQTDTWTEENTTITAQRTREPIDVVLPDVVLIAPAFVNAADLQGRRSGIQIQCCNVNARGGSVTNLVPSVPPLQGFSRSNCCNVVQIGATVFSLGSENTQYGFMQNLTCGIQDIKCSAYNCRRGWDCTRGKDSVIDGGIYPDGIGAHYITGVVIKNVLLISCRSSDNPAPLSFSGGDLTVENSNIVVPPGFGKAFQTRADIWKWIGKIHFKGNKFFFDAGDRDIVVFLNLQGPARTTAYNTGVVTEMFNSLVVDQTNQIRVGGTRSDGTPSNARLQLATIFNDWDDVQEKDQIVGGRIYLAPQVTFDNPAPLPGRTLPPDPTDMDATPVVIGANFPKCKINCVNFRRSIGGTYDMVVEGLPDLHVEILCDRAGPKAAGRFDLRVKDVRGQKLISTTYGGTRKTYIQTRETETVTFETPGFASRFSPIGDENTNRTYDETQVGPTYGGDVSTAKATVDGATAPLPDLFARRAYATPLTRALALLTGVAAAVQSFTTLGYATPGDGGGATYVRQASNYTLTALDFASADGAKWKNASFILTPQMLGAAADGVTNDRNAVATISTFGRPIKLIGRYKIDSTFSFAAGSYVFAEPGQGVLVSGAAGAIINSNARSNVTIKGVWFEGRMDAPDTAGLVQFANGSFVRLENCKAYDHKSFSFSFVNMRDSGWHRCVVRNTGFHDNVNYVASGSLFLPSNNGLPPELQNPDGWRSVNRNNYCTHCDFEEAYGIHVAYQTAFTGDHNRLYGRGDNPPGWGITHCSYSSFCHNEVSSGPLGGAAFDILVGYHLKVNDNTCWQCGGAGILFANITDSEACNNLCIDNWASKVNTPPSNHRGGIVLDCDTTQPNPTVARILLSGNICKNTQPAATQQNGLQIRNPATMDFASINIDSTNQFSGNSNEDITPPYWYSGRKARSNRAYVAPAYAVSGATDFDPSRAGLREVAERVAYVETLLAAQGAVGEVPFPLPGATLDMDFARGQYLGKQASDLTVVRANTATGLLPKDVGAESYLSFAANALPLVPGRGAVIMPAKTQYFVNPAAPATQTVTLAVGTYTCWCIGIASWIAATQGTGVATEIGSGGVTVRPGTPQTITVTTAGTFVFTVNGPLRFAQIENTAEPTAFIPTAGSSAGTVASLNGTAFTDIFGSVTAGTFYVDVIPRAPAPAAGVQSLFSLSDGTTNNRVAAFRQTTGEVQFRHTSAGTTTTLGSNLVVQPGQSCRVALSFGVGTNAFRNVINGNMAYFASPAAAPVGLNTLRLGVNEAATGQQGAMILRRIAFVPGVIPEHIARSYAAAP